MLPVLSWLESSIRIRTFGDWQEYRPGLLEVGLISHCGDSSEDVYLTTLSKVNVASDWLEFIGVWGLLSSCPPLDNIYF